MSPDFSPAPAIVGAQDRKRQQVRTEQARLLYANANTGVGATVFVASVLSYLQWTVIAHQIVLGWFVYTVIVSAARFTLARLRRPLRELIFHADGDFSATWLPFETRQDYWGTYTYDVKSQVLVLRLKRGNYLPTDTTPEGKALIDEAGRLVASGARFGTPPNSALRGGKALPSCGSIFVRQ